MQIILPTFYLDFNQNEGTYRIMEPLFKSENDPDAKCMALSTPNATKNDWLNTVDPHSLRSPPT